MKSKLSWVTFIPLALAAFFCKLARYILPSGSVFGLSDLMMDYVFLGAVVLIMLFAFLFCLLDKRISSYYIPHRNYVAGIVGIILALTLAGDGANNVFRMISTGEVEALKIIDSVLLLLTAIIFIVLGLSNFRSDSEGRRFVLFYVIPALFCAERMIGCFVGFTTISIRLADVPKLACYIFATLFFFNYAVVLSLTKTKNAVKSCFIFGFPAIASLLTCGVIKLVFEPDTQVIVNNAEALELALIGLYILAFIIELTAFVRDKDSVIIVEDDVVVQEEHVEGFVTKLNDEEEEDLNAAAQYQDNADVSDFLYTEVQNEDENEATYNDAEGYLTASVQEDEFDDRPAGYESKLDKIDKLILEISEQSDQ